MVWVVMLCGSVMVVVCCVCGGVGYVVMLCGRGCGVCGGGVVVCVVSWWCGDVMCWCGVVCWWCVVVVWKRVWCVMFCGGVLCGVLSFMCVN